MPETLTALVPVKAISERVPGKNMRLFNGKPLLHYILATLESVPEITRICVNTDSSAAADYARRFSKVTVHERPAALCGNHIPMNRIIAHDLSLAEGEHFLQTHATSPLLEGATIQKALAAYRALQTEDALFSVAEHRSRFFDAHLRPINHDPRVLLNTQDLPPVYEENSCLYLFSRKAFVEGGNNRLGTHAAMFPMSRYESQDIDTEEDFVLAEILWKILHGGEAA